MNTPRHLVGHAVALLTGCALPAAFAPIEFWPAAIVCPAALLALLRHLHPLTAALRAWCFGLGMFGTGTSWVYVSIHDYGAASLPLAAFLTFAFSAVLALFPALVCYAWARWLRQRHGGIALGFPAMWVLGEWWRGWMLTGFPWLYLGYSQLNGPLHGWAPVVGVLGLSLILSITAAALYLLLAALPALRATLSRLRERGIISPLPLAGEGSGERAGMSRTAIAAIAPLLLWAGALPLAQIEWTRPLGKPVSVAMVQGNIPQELKWEPGHLESTMRIYAELSTPLWGTDIVVWPEAAIPAYLDGVIDFVGTTAATAASHDSTLLLGIPTREYNPTLPRGHAVFNSLVAAGADSGLYHKRHLVPFGEFVPLEGLLRGLIAFFDLPMSSFISGPAEQAPLSVQGLRVAPFICYEIVYPDLVAAALPGADVLLTISNDTWFGTSAGPLQHLEMARMRALENGRPLIRSTNNGVSALVDHHGKILARGQQFTREVIRGEIQPTEGLTPFARFGSTAVLALVIVVALIVLALRPSQTR